MYASDAKDELNPCCPFAETVLRPGGVLLLRCEVGAEEEIHQRVTEEYDNWHADVGDGSRRALVARARVRAAGATKRTGGVERLRR